MSNIRVCKYAYVVVHGVCLRGLWWCGYVCTHILAVYGVILMRVWWCMVSV